MDRMIGNYVIGNAIGEGTFGKVRYGTHRDTGQTVRSSNYSCTRLP